MVKSVVLCVMLEMSCDEESGACEDRRRETASIKEEIICE